MSLMGVGTNILGYTNKKVDIKVQEVIKKGNLTSLNCPEEVLLAKKLTEMHPWSNMARFAKTGGEANAIAIRIARAAQNKDRHKIAICGYHGWHDWYLSSNLDNQKNLDNHLIASLKPNGVPSFLKNTCYPFEYGDYKKFDQLISKKNIGIIMMEVTRNKLLNLKFLNHVRNVSKKKGVILIFDECTSGFRETLGGIYKKTNVQPDMIVLGKALGNGYPITAVLGKKEIMSHAKQSFISSTFWTERLGPVAALKTLEIMEKIKSWKIISNKGKKLKKNLQKIGKQNGLNIFLSGLDSCPSYVIKSKNWNKYKTYISQELLKKNFLGANTTYLSIYHDNKMINKYLNSLNEIFAQIKKCENGEFDIHKLLVVDECHTGFERLN